MFRRLLRAFFGLKRALRPSSAPAAPPASEDPRAADPWVAAVLGALGERYKLGDDRHDGAQLLRRTGRARFNPMMVYLRPPQRTVVGFYEVRGHGEVPETDARRVLDAQVNGRLEAFGLQPAQDRVEDWGGKVLIRRYEGRCDDAAQAAGAVRFMCQESDQIMDTAAE